MVYWPSGGWVRFYKLLYGLFGCSVQEKRLLERISGWERGHREGHQPLLDVLRGSISAHLIRILNTKHETVLIDPKFGLPDFSNFGGGGLESGSLDEVAFKIASMIERYEPRLQDVQVLFDERGPNSVQMTFTISAMLKLDQGSQPFTLGAEIGSNGHIAFI